MSCGKFSTTTTQETSDTVATIPTNPITSSVPPVVKADDIELLCTPGSIPLNLIEDDTLLYLRRKFVAKVFNSQSGQDALFKLELPFMNAGTSKKIFYINRINKVFCGPIRGRDVVGQIARKEAFIKAVKSGQYDDDYTPSVRMLFDDELIKKTSDDTSQITENNPKP